MTGHGLVAHQEYPHRDTVAAIVAAGRAGFDGIDVNARTCRADKGWLLRRRRRIVLIHSADWWEHGFEPKPGCTVPRKPIEQLKLSQVRDLWSIEGHRSIMTLEQGISHCKRAKVVPCVEMKPSVWRLAEIVAAERWAAERSVPLVWMTMKRYGRTARIADRWERAAYKRMLLVARAGGIGMLIWRGSINWGQWLDVVHAVKSTPAGMPLPNGVVLCRTLLQRLRKRAGW